MITADDKFALILKKRSSKHPENIIKGGDPVSVYLLRQIYAAWKEKGSKLVLYEKSWVRQIEKIYSDEETFRSYFVNGLNTLLKQAIKILEEDGTHWDVKDEELYSTFQKLVFLKGRDGVFREFFDDIEQVIFSALQSDFSKRASLSKIGNNRENILSYAAVMLNTLLESLQTSVVSTSAVNDIIEQMNGAIVIITDKKNRIKFVSRKGRQLLKVDEHNLIGTDLNSVIDFHSKGKDNLPELKEIKIRLSSRKVVEASLVMIPSGRDTKAEEITYVICLSKEVNRSSGINANEVIDNFVELCRLPQITKVEIVKQVYTYGYRGNRIAFAKLLNLILLFAVKDTVPGKLNTITVHFSEILPNRFTLWVSYIGRGYKKKQVPKIFQNELKLMKEYCDDLNGRISIESQYLGKTTIIVILSSNP